MARIVVARRIVTWTPRLGTSRLWRTLRETNSRSVRTALYRCIREETVHKDASLGQLLSASGSIWPPFLDDRS